MCTTQSLATFSVMDSMDQVRHCLIVWKIMFTPRSYTGADNFFDAGSCIDGRLTSAWNWCSTLEKKRYFPVFLLAGAHISCSSMIWGVDVLVTQDS